eukprot:TRINITY_DN12457_c0_g1_i1.p1 TRINITY_DN12457_c0_g1~~TRINITY_DN12457_c0_g1_i1.p1  ORF type:complete len:664 (+),score=137.20 TRINITY_DN12457_c0_g1_i1:90-2081(+)
MNFPVPWRALLPLDAVAEVCGPNNATLRDICSSSGAGIDVSGEGETPATLSDKICTLSGLVEQKETACRRIVDCLRRIQEVADQEPGVFVVIVPSSAAPAVIGTKGSQIKEIIELSGAEISVGKENIIGMNDQPIGITGTGGQVVSAVSKINAICQDLADRGRLQPGDFKYREGAVSSSGPPPGLQPRPSGGNPLTATKFVAPTQVAGWIIGKQGRHIRELQENSGAHIQVHKDGDVPPGVPATERIIEIGGRREAKAEGIQIVLMAIDSMPALQAPRETVMLLPKVLTGDNATRDIKQMSGADIEVRDLPGHNEALCTLVGTIEARIKAAQQVLNMLEEAAANGTVAADSSTSAAPAYASRPPASQSSFSRPAESLPASQPFREQASPARAAAPPGLERNETRQDTGAPAARSVTFADAGASPPPRSFNSADERPSDSFSRSKPTSDAPIVLDPYAGQPSLDRRDPAPAASNHSQPPYPAASRPQDTFRQEGLGGAAPATHQPSSFASKEAAAPPAATSFGSMGASTNGSLHVGMSGSGPASGAMSHAAAAPASSPGLGFNAAFNEVLFRQALQESGFVAGNERAFSVLVDHDVLQHSLIPQGHLAEIAQKCQLRIDVGPEVNTSGRCKQLTFTGSLVANAMAAYFLQERISWCSQSSNGLR